MNYPQLVALQSPCRTPAERLRPTYGRCSRFGEIFVHTILTVDVESDGCRGGHFVPGAIESPAAWHASVSLRTCEYPDRELDPLRHVPLIVGIWSRSEARAALESLTSALAGVGRNAPEFAFRSIATFHLWRGLSGHERDAIGPWLASIPIAAAGIDR